MQHPPHPVLNSEFGIPRSPHPIHKLHKRQFCYRDLAGMPTLGDIRTVGKPRESKATTLAKSPCLGGKYSIPIPDSPFPTLT